MPEENKILPPDPNEFIPAKDVLLCAFMRKVEGTENKYQVSFLIGQHKSIEVVNSSLVQLQAMVLSMLQERMYGARAAQAPKIAVPGNGNGGIIDFMRRKN